MPPFRPRRNYRKKATSSVAASRGATVLGRSMRKRVGMRKAYRKGPRRGARSLNGPKNLRTVQETLGQTTESKAHVINPRAHTAVAKIQKLIGLTQNWNQANGNRTIVGTPGLVAYDFPTIFAAQTQLSSISDYILSTAAISPGAPVRFLLEDIYFNRQIYNRSNVPVTCKIYVVKARRDMWYSTTTPMVFTGTNPGGVIYPWNGEPVSCIQQGYNSQANTGSGSTAYLSPAVVPEDVDMFKKYFSVVHTEEICLAEGGSHKFNLHIKYDKICDSSVYSNTPLTSLEGLTYFMFMRCVGAPVYDITQNTSVLSAPDLGAVDQYDFKFTQVWNPIIASKTTTANPYVAGDVLRTINPGSGQPENVQTV